MNQAEATGQVPVKKIEESQDNQDNKQQQEEGQNPQEKFIGNSDPLKMHEKVLDKQINSEENIIFLQKFFLKGMAVIYLFAFSSWFVQISALYGRDGLLPIGKYLKSIKKPSMAENINNYPSLFWYSQQINYYLTKVVPSLSSFDEHENVFYLICIIAMLICIGIIWDRKMNIFVGFTSYFVLWILYLSIFKIGQTFASFQWDTMLLEVGFLTMFFIPKRRGDKESVDEINVVVRELLRWLAFRLYYSSGVLKLLSQCPTWWNLTALHYHFESQPLPHILSWYFHQLPDIAKRFMVASNFITLIGGSIMMLLPYRPLRIWGAMLNFSMQIMIMISGHYNFFNMLSILITMTTLDDQILEYLIPNWIRILLGLPLKQVSAVTSDPNQAKKRLSLISSIVLNGLLCIGINLALYYFFFPLNSIQTGKLPFNENDVRQHFSEGYIPNLMIFSSVALLIMNFFNYTVKYFDKEDKVIRRNFAAIFALLMYVLTSFIFLQGIERSPMSFPTNSHQVTQLYQMSMKINLAHSYGLFRRMTGIDGREELIFQGSNDMRNWASYEFYYKPGSDLQHLITFCTPHQPRLDWQLWFSAFRNQSTIYFFKSKQVQVNMTKISEEYTISLISKLFFNSESFMTLVKTNPFKDKPPQYVRILKYKYRFTNETERQKTGNYWRKIHHEEHMSAIKATDRIFTDALKQQNILGYEEQKKCKLHPFALLPIEKILITIFILLICTRLNLRNALFAKAKNKQLAETLKNQNIE